MRYLISFFVLFFSSITLLSAQTDTVFNQTDANSLKQGYWKKEYPNGKLMYKGYFKDNKPVGVMKRYYNTGDIEAIFKFDSTDDYSHAVLYYNSGSVAAKGKYYKKLKDSLWTYYSYYTHAITSTESYNKGVKNGMEKLYYSNGQVSDEKMWQNGAKEGVWDQYFEDGTVKLKAHYSKNKMNGEYKLYYPGGGPYIFGQYLDDLRNGKWTFYNDSGKVKYILNYVNGKAKNEQALIKQDKAFFKKVQENMGKYHDPTIEDLMNREGGAEN